MSTDPRELIIYGAGGFGREIASMCDSGNTGTSGCYGGPGQPPWKPVAFVDDTPGYPGQTFYGVPCLGHFAEIAPTRAGAETWCFIAVGDNEGRMQAAKRAREAGWKMATVVHSTAYFGRDAELGEGCFFGPFITISPNVRIGRHVLINTRASVGHHVFLGDFAQVSLNASVLGRARVEKGAMIGAHAVVMSDITVGAWATVAVGTPVLRPVKAGHTVCLPLAHTIFERKVLPEE